MVKPFIIFISLILLLTACNFTRYTNASSREQVKLPTSMFTSGSPEDYAQFWITEGLSVRSFDNYPVNWYGSYKEHFITIPSGLHKIVYLPTGYTDAGSIQYEFSRGRQYVFFIVEETAPKSFKFRTTEEGRAVEKTMTSKTAIVMIMEYDGSF